MSCPKHADRPPRFSKIGRGGAVWKLSRILCSPSPRPGRRARAIDDVADVLLLDVADETDLTGRPELAADEMIDFLRNSGGVGGEFASRSVSSSIGKLGTWRNPERTPRQAISRGTLEKSRQELNASANPSPSAKRVDGRSSPEVDRRFRGMETGASVRPSRILIDQKLAAHSGLPTYTLNHQNNADNAER